MTTTTGTNTNTAEITPKTPASVTLLHKTKYNTRSYTLHVGFVKDGELPQYVVVNNETGVVEFNNEVLIFAREWMAHFQKQLDNLDEGKPTEASPPVQQVAFN